ncbi:MAG: MFS transporter [Eubacteriales bacterium]|nr:MFS transporter [Eubacteriales bacterium]
MSETTSGKRFSKAEKSWILYDVANSAFIMIVTATIPIYFRGLAEGAGMSSTAATSLWGSATSISILILALISPILGAVADYENMKKRIFTVFFVIAIAGGVLFTFAPGWLSFLIFFIIARIGYAACNVFYDAMLIDVTTNERMDRVSTCGYAFGYIGSCIPFVAGLLLILNCDAAGLSTVTATRISFVITMVWWVIMTVPLYKNVHQRYSLPRQQHVISHTFRRLADTFRKLAKNKRMLFFIIGYFCYIDGVYTIISMATTYGGEVGIDSNSMVLALLLTQFVAFPCSILSGTLAQKYGSMRMIKLFIIMYMGICVFGYGLDTELEFWILAVAVGICQGGIQALSRSYFGKIIPKEESSEYFGFFDVFGKFADFFGPLIMAACAFFLHDSKYGVLSLIILFIAGFVLISLSEKHI